MIHKAVNVWGSGRYRRLQRQLSQSHLQTLKQLIHRAKGTEFGQQFDFTNLLRTNDIYQAFTEKVPIFDYGLWLDWLGDWKPEADGGVQPLHNRSWPETINWFCLSSGTTSGRSKFLPYSPTMAKISQKAALDLAASITQTFPRYVPWKHKTLYMSGSTKLQPNQNGAVAGDMSGLTKYLASSLMQFMVLPPDSISSLEPWEKRLQALVQFCTQNRQVGMLSGIPIWQLTLLKRLVEKTGHSVQENLPELKFLIHGGMSMDPYRNAITELLGPEIQLLEVYAASELGLAAFQKPGQDGMQLYHHYGVFYEFEDDQGQLFTLENVPDHVPVQLILSNCSGLWRYRIGDVLTFADAQRGVLARVGRDKTTSAFDEKVTEFEVEQAISDWPEIQDFCMGPDIEQTCHLWFCVGIRPSNFDEIQMDKKLRQQNQDYDDYRGDGRIKSPRVLFLPNRSELLQVLGREEGGQRKFARLLSAEEVEKLKVKFLTQ